MKASKYWRAIAAAAMAGGGSLGTAMGDGTVTQAEGVTALLLALGGLGVVWRVPNQEQKDPA